MLTHLKFADIEWIDGYPFSRLIGDKYYVGALGLEETRHIYLESGAIYERFYENEYFTIGEIGFGTGLNFLETMRQWDKGRKRGEQLIYVSIESTPLKPDDLSKAVSLFQEIKEQGVRLIEAYQGLTKGLNLFHFIESGVTLILLVGEASEVLERYSFKADHWYLDGFCPKKNQSAWDLKLLEMITLKTKVMGTFSTFTAVGSVKRCLLGLGWDVDKVKGFGSKRHRLKGFLKGKEKEDLPKLPHSVVIEGSGIAGWSCAYFLNHFGVSTRVLERGLMKASCAPWIKIRPGLQKDLTPYSCFGMSSFLFSTHFYEQLQKKEGFEISWGLDHLSRDEREQRKLDLLSSLPDYQKILVRLPAIAEKAFRFNRGCQFKSASLLRVLETSCSLNEVILTREFLSRRIGGAGFMMGEELVSDLILASSFGASLFLPTIRQSSMIRGVQDYLENSEPTFERHNFSPRAADGAFVGFRANTENYMPIYGELEKGLYASIYHGSRGYCSSPYVGLLLTLEILGLFKDLNSHLFTDGII